ncbi:alpha-L-arabinofuranosidase [Paraflavitalea soli]|uniref:non-reducing end alpha-L-arabinofuranosidase n=1 Tax=Paraflavitalea soli TaxID=2315862 RepID=A0A3B7MEH0_9BACT|nr:alpha-L-arabinofuranosidase C-terminal domain-containing protein [Paraflavitalea soli]AXY72738.1 alpha-L-arabinofuranosidase [Paraflavitalea soli]
MRPGTSIARYALLLAIGLLCLSNLTTRAQGPQAGASADAVYLFSYSTAKNNNHNGLHFAWSRDRVNWQLIGNEFGFLRSDYGRWGAEKKMITPYLIQTPGGDWQCVWALNDREKLFAHASSPDLVYWDRQSYPLMTSGANVLKPIIQYNQQQAQYNITYTDATGKYFQVTTKDFKTYTPAATVPASQYTDASITINLPAGPATGQLHRVPWATVDKLIKDWEGKQYRNNLYGEQTAQDAQRFANLKPVDVKLAVQADRAKPISNLLTGVFFEDINYAADGGIYAELIQNRDFEYAPGDKEGHDTAWKSTHSWTLQGDHATFTIDTATPIHINNPHYAVLDIKAPGAVLFNTGFDGITIRKGEQYKLSLFTKQTRGKGKLLVQLVSREGKVLAQTNITPSTSGWKRTSAMLVANADAPDARLQLQPLSIGRLQLDMISFFPQKTFKERENGLRADLAQAVADIHPRFIRFPGGCVAHGDGLGNIYHWKNTIGPLEARIPQRNLWGYHQTAGLGYFEYFRYCADIGAEPLPVLSAGVPCQNSGTSATGGGQQGGIPLEQMDAYIQDILDLVEYANGDINTTWGKKRAEAGHPQPFNLKYIGIGNEDLITDIFEQRFTMIYQAVKAKYPGITVIGTVGPFWEGTDYEEGWQLAGKLKVPMVDEHYYVPPGWLIHNQDFYDKYDHSKSKVYLGEYAAHLPGRPNNLETALAEALYLTALERNGDVVSMSSYAPLLAKEGHTQWNPDLIYFNNSEVKPTVGYEVQKLYGLHAGDQYLPAAATLSNNQEAVRKRIAWSVVRDTKTQDLVIKLVNLLPVSVHTTMDLGSIHPTGATAVKTVLQGQPADKNARPVTGSIPLAEVSRMELPAYSFTVIRLKTN